MNQLTTPSPNKLRTIPVAFSTSSANQYHPVVERIFDSRDVLPEAREDFFSWELKKLPDLTALHGLQAASERIISAIDEKQSIGVYGDYDVDGTTSCALFFQFFKMLGVEVDIFQPSRFVEGYGLHKSSIDQAKENDLSLLITVDCGISNVEAADYAKQQGLDLIITDHHKDACPQMPEAVAVVNPNRRDEGPTSPMRFLAGVGVAFAVCLQVKRDLEKRGESCPSIYPLLQYVAIGTISDLVPLNSMNLKLVRHGLRQLKKSQYPGLLAFFTEEELQRDEISSEKISFFIGPLINSKGRLEHPERALQLLIADNEVEARQHFKHLEKCNQERKYIQGQVYQKALKQVLKSLSRDQLLINIVYESDYHEGVIGIVASKLVENFEVPAIVFTDSEEAGVIKGSARTAGALDMFACLQANKDLFLKFGGHKAAAGLSLVKENLPELRKRMEKHLSSVPVIERTTLPYFDTFLSFGEIDLKLLRALENMGPFGNGNSRPLFKMDDMKVESFQILKEVHVRWNFTSKKGLNKSIKGISFNYVGRWGMPHPEEIMQAQEDGQNPTVLFSISSNFYKGNEYIQMMVNSITL